MSSTARADSDLGAIRPRWRLARKSTRSWLSVPMRAELEADVLRVCAVAVVAGLGLLTVAVADTIARGGSKWGEPLFWAGMFMLWIPSSVRIIGRNATRTERIALLVLLGMGMYMVSILASPRYFTGYDEFLHWRTAQDVVSTGRLFNANPGLIISPLYPGMEIATNAITNLTGLSVVMAGRLVVGAARLILVLALYLLYERIGRSSWLASVATALYFTNPQFFAFDSAYSYESLGIALAVLTIYAVARGWIPDSKEPSSAVVPPVRTPSYGASLGATMLVALPFAATVVTHHVTSIVLVLTLVVLAVLSFVTDVEYSRLWLWGIALAGAALVILWVYQIAGQVIRYLEVPISGGISEVVKLIRGEGVSRHIFHNYLGPPTPLVVRAGSYAFAAITVLAVPFGLLRMWRTRRFDTFMVLFALGSLLYPVTGLFHFTSDAVLGSRAFAFIFVPAAFCIAMAAGALQLRKVGTAWTAALVIGGAVLLYGGVALSNPPWDLLPGPYLVSADDRSIELEGISAAAWAGRFLPHNSRIAADRINSVLMMTYGDQWPARTNGKGLSLAPIFLTRQVTPLDRKLIREASLRYLVVDYRLTRALPWVGFYYYTLGESGAPTYRRPIPVAAFAKYDRTPGSSRVFDSGNIVIFDVGELGRNG